MEMILVTPKHGGLRHQLANVKRLCVCVWVELRYFSVCVWVVSVCLCICRIWIHTHTHRHAHIQKCCTSSRCLFRLELCGAWANENDKCLFNSVFFSMSAMNINSNWWIQFLFELVFGSLSNLFYLFFSSVCPFFSLFIDMCVCFFFIFFLLQIPLNAFYHLDKLYNFVRKNRRKKCPGVVVFVFTSTPAYWG